LLQNLIYKLKKDKESVGTCKAYQAALISDCYAFSQTLQDYEHEASVLCVGPVFLPAFASTKLYCSLTEAPCEKLG